ncbi:MAG: O-antigen ligase family protein [Kiritimatiellae bacterium]|nr:O-antigen ligase family protein [Kiritimatiellia bacterium]
MSFIHRNIAAIFIFVLVAALGWIYGGTMSSVIRPVLPWLIAIMYEVALCFPQRRDGESTSHARKRVWRALREDPLTWVVVSFLVLTSIPFINVGKTPEVAILPFCTHIMKHYGVFLWFASALSAALLAKHSLTRSGKRTLIEMIVWNGVAMAALGFVQLVAGAPGPLWSTLVKNPGHFFSTFGYPNIAGDYFTVLFCLSVAQWRNRLDEIRHNLEGTQAAKRIPRHKFFWMKHYLLIAALVNFFAALNTLSRAAIILVSVSATILFSHTIVVALARMKKVDRVKAGAFCALAMLMIAVAATAFMPDGVHREMKTVSSREALDRVTGRGESHSVIAMQIWREHLLFGCGGWGYATLCVDKQPPRTYWAPGSANVHNDHLQFLVEHGLVGYGLLVAAVALLLMPVAKSWIALAKGVRFLPAKRQPPPPQSFFAFPGSAFSLIVAATVPVVHAFGDCPLRSSAVLTLFYVTLACMPGYLPREERKDKET